MRERQPLRCIGLHGMYHPVRNLHVAEKRAVFRRVAPQINGIGIQAVFARKHNAGNAGARPEVANAAACREVGFKEQLLAEL